MAGSLVSERLRCWTPEAFGLKVTSNVHFPVFTVSPLGRWRASSVGSWSRNGLVQSKAFRRLPLCQVAAWWTPLCTVNNSFLSTPAFALPPPSSVPLSVKVSTLVLVWPLCGLLLSGSCSNGGWWYLHPALWRRVLMSVVFWGFSSQPSQWLWHLLLLLTLTEVFLSRQSPSFSDFPGCGTGSAFLLSLRITYFSPIDRSLVRMLV